MASPHDSLFKHAFSDVEEASPLLRSILPAELVAEVDWTTLTVSPGSFVDESLSDRHTDLLFEAKIGDHRGLLYLLVEHQSSVDGLMAYRMLRYVTRIWDRWLRDHPGANELPRIVPVVVYVGPPSWNAPTAVEALVEGAATLWVPRMSFILDDLSQVSDEALRQRGLTVFAELVILSLARLRGSRDPLGLVEGWLPLLSRLLTARNGLERFRALIEYLASVADFVPGDLQPVVRRLGSAAEETAMTAAERLRQQGRHDKAVELILRQLTLRFGELSGSVTSRVDSGNEADFERWSERVLLAATLDQVFDDSTVP